MIALRSTATPYPLRARASVLINCVIDPTAGTESGHLQNLNPQTQVDKEKRN